MISAKHLSKSFGKVKAVNDLSLDAHDGQITGILGPNGAGKTTTLRMLYALLKPDFGSVAVEGIDPSAHPLEARQQLGVMPDSKGLYKHLTARENIRYYGQIHGLDKAIISDRIDQLAVDLNMLDFIDRKTEGFSQGQRVKTALARALIHEPKNLVLDEPTNGLDVMSTRAMREFLLNIKERGHCILFSSHIMQEVAALCDRILIISQGQLVADGSPDELRAQTGIDDLEDLFVNLVAEGESA